MGVTLDKKSLKIPKGQSEIEEEQTTQWPKQGRKGQQKIMVCK
jgi:hypothetical protein